MSKEIDVNELRSKRSQKKATKKIIILTAVALLALILIVTAFIVPALYSKVYKNVTCAGVDVSGLTKEDTFTFLTEKFEDFAPQVVISAEKEDYLIDFNIIAQYDIEKTAENVFNTGRKNIFTKFWYYYFGKIDVPLETIINKEEIVNQINIFQESLDGGYVDNSYKIDDDILIVTAGKSGKAFDPEQVVLDITDAFSKGDNVILTPEMNEKTLEKINVDELYNEVYQKPVDAVYDEETSKIIPHKVGYSFDKAKAREVLANVKEGSSYKIQLSIAYPDVTEDTLTGKMFADTLASYSTRYNPGEVNRTHNMYLASSKVNGTVLAPGEVFSYNKVVGERTVAKGYRNAKIFENGRVVDGLAGGICQVSTTIYNAALYSNMEIVERKNHSFPVAYAPMGQDATVVMNSIDFRFKNNTSSPVKIVSSVSGGLCTVTILGTDKNHYKVQVQNAIVGSKERSIEYENNPELEAGVEKVIQEGSDGYTIRSTRIVTKNGQVIKTESLPSSYYIPLKKIIQRNETPEEVPENPEEPAVPVDPDITTEPVVNPVEPQVPVEPTEPVSPIEPENGEKTIPPEGSIIIEENFDAPETGV